jgi:hypothetical protein
MTLAIYYYDSDVGLNRPPETELSEPYASRKAHEGSHILPVTFPAGGIEIPNSIYAHLLVSIL